MHNPCSYHNCPKPRKYKELCDGHKQQQRRGEELRPLRNKRRSHYWEGGEKVCPECGEEKQAGEYARDKHQPSGRRAYCLKCEWQRKKQNKKEVS